MASDQADPAESGAGTAALARRFERLWTQLHGHEPVTIYNVLAGFYGQQHRRYHTLTHVADCLRELDALRTAHAALLHPTMWDAVETALWFHDVIHEPRAGDNEERSADFFEAVAAEAMFPSWIIAAVRRLILATKINVPSSAAEEQVISDCDLASLGYVADVFKRSSAAIRTEYGFLTDREFAETRRATFLRLIGGPSIFCTEFMRLRYERQARANLGAALEGL